MTTTDFNQLTGLSDSLTAAVERAGTHTVTVKARHRGAATGIAWRKDLVVTASHVVEHDENCRVVLPDGKTVSATLAGRDPSTDIAILTVADGTTTASTTLFEQVPSVGQLVVAVGRPGDLGLSASFGAISSVGTGWRVHGGGRIDQLIRPDLTFYPGFSGGPLIDSSGRTVGLNTSGLSRNMNITIPTMTVNRVVEQLLKLGTIKRGYLGVRMQSVQLSERLKTGLHLDDEHGLLVVGVEQDGPAEKAGLLVGDILVGIERRAVTESDAVQAILDTDIVGKTVDLRVVRGGDETHVSATVGERPSRRHRHG